MCEFSTSDHGRTKWDDKNRQARRKFDKNSSLGLNTLCVQSAQPRTRSSVIAFLRTVLVWLSTCVSYQLNFFQTTQKRNLGRTIRDCALCTHSVARPLENLRKPYHFLTCYFDAWYIWSLIYYTLKVWQYHTFNLRPGGGLSHLRLNFAPPPPNSKTNRARETGKIQLKAHQKLSRNYFGNFFARIKIVASRGQKCRKVQVCRDCRTSRRKTSIISGTVRAKANPKWHSKEN